MIKNLGMADLEYKANSELGEGAMWHPAENILYWIDITKGILNQYNPETRSNKSFNLGSMIGTVVPHHKPGVIVALESGIYHFTARSKLEQIIDFPEPGKPENRFNDGKCDPAGRFWVGTMNKNAKVKEGSLYCVERNYIGKKIAGLTIPNGICWLKNSSKMFFIDSIKNCVLSYDFDLETGKIKNKKVVLIINKKMGIPDGMTIDKENNLWIALWGGGAVIKCNPFMGEISEIINVPAPNVTSCSFGGKNLSKLFITTARNGLTKEQLIEFPLSGSLFSYNPKINGVKANSFTEYK